MAQEFGTFYKPLAKDEGQIRLLKLLAGTASDQIHCRVIVTTLTKYPIFEALSYVWGAPENPQEIYVNDVNFNVTQSLYTILRQLRYRDRIRTIWVDQICINQSDKAERSHQVGLMSDIYSGCSNCLVWLGRTEICHVYSPLMALSRSQPPNWAPLDSSKLVQDESGAPSITARLFSALYELSHNVSIDMLSLSIDGDFLVEPHRNKVYETIRWASIKKKILLESGGDIDEAALHLDFVIKIIWITSQLRIIFDLPWWSRIWTVQEIVLPPKAILIYGSYTITWRDFAEAIRQVKDALMKDRREVFHRNFIKFFLNISHKIEELEAIRREQPSHMQASVHQILRYLCQFRHREAKDPRDKVYGLLGIINRWSTDDSDNLIVADYSLSVAEVYKKIALRLIEGTNSLDIFNNSPQSSIEIELPSWAIDWSYNNLPNESLDQFSQAAAFSVLPPTDNIHALYSRITKCLPIS